MDKAHRNIEAQTLPSQAEEASQVSAHDRQATPTTAAVLKGLPSAAYVALIVIAVIASLYFLQWASPFLVPLTMGIILALLCNPLVRRLQRWHVPRWAGASLAILALWGSGLFVSYCLQDNFIALVDGLPDIVEQAAKRFEGLREGGWSTLNSARKAATALEKAATAVTDEPVSVSRSGLRVRMESSATNLRDFIIAGSTSIVSLLAELMVISFLVFFLLTGGEDLKRKLLRTVGRTLKSKKSVVRMIDAISTRIQSQLLVLCTVNISQGVVTGLVFHALGLHNAMMWGVAIALAHFIPYFGAGLIAGASLIAGLLQFSSWSQALMPAVLSLVIATLIGNLITVWLQSRTARIDTASIFVGMLLWAWLWGPAGLVLGAPMMAIVKAICDHVKPLKPIAAMMEGSLVDKALRRTHRHAPPRTQTARASSLPSSASLSSPSFSPSSSSASSPSPQHAAGIDALGDFAA